MTVAGENFEMEISTTVRDAQIVYIVDDDVSMREAIMAFIDDAGWQPIAFASAREFLAYPRARVPSCLILDVMLPDLNGLQLQQEIAFDQPTIPIIFITGYGDVPTSVRAMKAGAVEFLIKPFDDSDLLDAVRGALERSAATMGERVKKDLLRRRYESLTEREREVMQLVVCGMMNKQIAAELSISIVTVKAHRGQVMRKMNARSLAELVDFAGDLQLPRRGQRS
jgi:FixJ family two-component response regulator